jgi:CubicO group peptidase (beta-lactamase class C family)
VPAWRDPHDPRHGITVDNLLRHNSGLALDETGSPFDATTRMLMMEDDTARAFSTFCESKGFTKGRE